MKPQYISSPSHLLSPGRRHLLRWVMPILLVLLFLMTLIWLPRQAQQMESSERQEQLIADSLWVEQAIRFQLSRDDESMRLIAREIVNDHLKKDQFRSRLNALLRNNREFYRVTWFSPDGKPLASTDDFPVPRHELSAPSQQAEEQARTIRAAPLSGVYNANRS